jgi:hypothetical protein
MKTLKVGIASDADMKARTMAIAKGELRPKPGDPTVWFTSPESLPSCCPTAIARCWRRLPTCARPRCTSWPRVLGAHPGTCRVRSKRWSAMAWFVCTKASAASCARRSHTGTCGLK